MREVARELCPAIDLEQQVRNLHVRKPRIDVAIELTRRFRHHIDQRRDLEPGGRDLGVRQLAGDD